MSHINATVTDWIKNRVKQDEIDRYLVKGKSFIDDNEIAQNLYHCTKPDKKLIHDIIAKSLSITTLTPQETAYLLNVTDPEMLETMYETAGEIKRKVYDNRIVTFAPLYAGNACVNNCLYCGFRQENSAINRRILTIDEIKEETSVLVGQIGHKRLIVVYGEHPATDIDYMIDTIKAIYSIKINKKGRMCNIRRVNVNAAPLEIDALKRLKDVGIGTYQVFQETYHRPTYEKYHPQGTLKGNYLWRLYAMHRAIEAGVDDVGIGALFGLYEWKYEVMALLYHSRELETRYGVGPHTISFPRIEPALNTPESEHVHYPMKRNEFQHLVTVLRLAVPHCGMILTAREDAETRREIIPLGCTQTDASTKIGVGEYSATDNRDKERQQFIIGDSRSLDEVVRELAKMGYITSFCTAGYRCGRTGESIMELLKCGKEKVFCKLNAIITYREWLDDFATPETKELGEKLIKKEIQEVKERLPVSLYTELKDYYTRTSNGERDLYF
jgi:2-iminoacetate synthase